MQINSVKDFRREGRLRKIEGHKQYKLFFGLKENVYMRNTLYMKLVTLRSRYQPGRVRFQQGTLKVAHSGSDRRGCYTIFFPVVTMATGGTNLCGGKGDIGLLI